MKILIAMIIGGLLVAGCDNRGHGFDTNAAEHPEGDSGRTNSMTNEEAHRRTNPEATAVETFVRQAAESGNTEIKLSELIREKTTNKDVLAFASSMIKDHGGANRELKSFASEMGIELADDCAKCQDRYDSLSRQTGAQLEAMYVRMMVADHKDAVRMFSDAVRGNDRATGKWAKGKLPVLRHHLSMAEALQTKVDSQTP